MANESVRKGPAFAEDVEFPVYEPIWDYETPEEYLAAKGAGAGEEVGGKGEQDQPQLKVEGIRLSADDGTQVIAVTRFERDEGSRKPGAVAKRAWYWVKEKVLWLVGVIIVSATATAVWQMIG